MKTKILAMMSAFILTITCIAPLNVSATYIVPSAITLNVFDYDGNKISACDLSPGSGNVACGTNWSGHDVDFGSYEILFNLDLPANYTIEYNIDTTINGLSDSDGVNQATIYYFLDGWQSMDTSTTRVGIYRNHVLYNSIHGEFTNHTNYNTIMFQSKYTSNASTLIDVTIIKLENYKFNIYDEYGRLIAKIENGTNLIYDGLNGINGSINTLGNNLNTWITNSTNNIIEYINRFRYDIDLHFDNLHLMLIEQTNALKSKLDDVISAIRGDDQNVDSKDEVDSTTDNLDNTINNYEDIENSVVDDFNNNFGSIKPNNDLITNNDFINSSTFVAAQMTRIYESNSIIKMTITFGLIIGLAFTVIGISVRR